MRALGMARRHTERAAVWSWARALTGREASLYQDVRQSSRSYTEETEAQEVRAGGGEEAALPPQALCPPSHV